VKGDAARRSVAHAARVTPNVRVIICPASQRADKVSRRDGAMTKCGPGGQRIANPFRGVRAATALQHGASPVYGWRLAEQ
jgi:hypothetical protein